jgi:FixJ family two-component response regulator
VARKLAAVSRKGRGVPARPLISVIDDDESMRSALATLLRSAGYDSRDFESAEEFLGCADAERSACIITDIQMPGMSGIDLKEHLNARQWSVPVIMLTARHEPSLEQRAIASGAAYFLRKPFDAAVLIRCIEGVIKL